MKKQIIKTISILIILFMIINCLQSKNRITSKEYNNKKKKIEVLQKYYNPRTPILNTEFDIYDVNINNRSIPGPSDRNYKIVLKIQDEYLEMWEEKNELITGPFNYEWARDLISGNDDFVLTGPVKFYKNEYREMIIFHKTGVVLINIVQH